MADVLGDRMKKYEAVTRSILLPHSLTILRIDGRAFHTYLAHASKPFDFEFIEDMQWVGRAMCREISGCLLAYGQSDEISFLISDMHEQSEPWFGGVVQKMVSVAASFASCAMIARRELWQGYPQFDARVFTVPSWLEAANYFIWRQRDAVRNSVSMAAQATFGHKLLQNKGSGEMQEMLFSKGINWNNYPDAAKRGWVLTRAVREAEVSYTDKRTNTIETTTAERTFWDVSYPNIDAAFLIPYINGGYPPAPAPRTGDADDAMALDPARH